MAKSDALVVDDAVKVRRESSYHSRSKSSTRSRSPSHSRQHKIRRSTSQSRGYSRRTRSPVPKYRRDASQPTRCVGVFGLDFEASRRDLEKMFSRYGELEDVNVVIDNFTGKSRGFAFVYFRHLSDAIEAKEDAHGRRLGATTIRTDYSFTKRPHSPTPGRYMGRSDYRRSSRYTSPSRRRRNSRSRSFS